MIQSKIFFSFIFLLFISCKYPKDYFIKGVVGTYKLESKIGNTTIVLHPNNTFNYKSEIPFDESTSHGFWQVIGNKIILKSDSSLKNNFIKFSKEFNKNDACIKVIDKDSTPIMNALIIINKASNNIYHTDYDGKLKFSDILEKKINRIEIRTLGLTNNNDFIDVKDKKTTIIAKVYHKEPFIFFNNKEILIKKKMLVLDGYKYKKQEDK